MALSGTKISRWVRGFLWSAGIEWRQIHVTWLGSTVREVCFKQILLFVTFFGVVFVTFSGLTVSDLHLVIKKVTWKKLEIMLYLLCTFQWNCSIWYGILFCLYTFYKWTRERFDSQKRSVLYGWTCFFWLNFIRFWKQSMSSRHPRKLTGTLKIIFIWKGRTFSPQTSIFGFKHVRFLGHCIVWVY